MVLLVAALIAGLLPASSFATSRGQTAAQSRVAGGRRIALRGHVDVEPRQHGVSLGHADRTDGHVHE